VHTLLTAEADGDVIRKLLKRWLGPALATHLPLKPEQTFWAECGSVKWVWTPDYFERVREVRPRSTSDALNRKRQSRAVLGPIATESRASVHDFKRVAKKQRSSVRFRGEDAPALSRFDLDGHPR
jgi:hypothetical protein